jgi:hypothetical protein
MATCSHPLIKRSSSGVLSAVKKHFHLPKACPFSIIFRDCTFGAEEMEIVFLAKSHSSF